MIYFLERPDRTGMETLRGRQAKAAAAESPTSRKSCM